MMEGYRSLLLQDRLHHQVLCQFQPISLSHGAKPVLINDAIPGLSA